MLVLERTLERCSDSERGLGSEHSTPQLDVLHYDG